MGYYMRRSWGGGSAENGQIVRYRIPGGSPDAGLAGIGAHAHGGVRYAHVTGAGTNGAWR
jgi:uncharacterized protein YijF (DUF1287 family)